MWVTDISALYPQENDNLTIVHLEILVRLHGRILENSLEGREVDPTFLLVEDLDMAASASQFLHCRVTH